MGEDQARPALGEIKQDVLKPIRGMSLRAWSGWQDQKRGQGLRRHKQSEWRAGGGLCEQGRGVVGVGGEGRRKHRGFPCQESRSAPCGLASPSSVTSSGI